MLLLRGAEERAASMPVAELSMLLFISALPFLSFSGGGERETHRSLSFPVGNGRASYLHIGQILPGALGTGDLC